MIDEKNGWDVRAVADSIAHCLSAAAEKQPGAYLRFWRSDVVSIEIDDLDLIQLAATILRGRPVPDCSAKDAISAAEQHLRTARFGLEDMRQRTDRFQSGLHNAVVFGRAVTFALQNMRSTVPAFEKWYEQKRVEMREDPLVKFFAELRTDIEKTAKRHTLVSAQFEFDDNVMRRLQPAPPGAFGLFIGDQNGGSGWQIRNPDGTTEKYYVDLPPDIGEASVSFAGAPEDFRDAPAQEVVAKYLDVMGALITEAKRVFLT